MEGLFFIYTKKYTMEGFIMYHPRLKGNAYEAGKHYAEILYKNGFQFSKVTEEKLKGFKREIRY